MISKKELFERATLKRAEIANTEQEKKRKEEEEIQRRVDQYITYCEHAMEQAANKGNFSVEVEVSGCDEVKRRLAVAFSQFSPKWHGDGHTKEYINLSWGIK